MPSTDVLLAAIHSAVSEEHSRCSRIGEFFSSEQRPQGFVFLHGFRCPDEEGTADGGEESGEGGGGAQGAGGKEDEDEGKGS